MLSKILDLRQKYINKQNIRKLYFNNYNSTEIKKISIEHLNMDIFDRYKQFSTSYHDKLFIPSISTHF